MSTPEAPNPNLESCTHALISHTLGRDHYRAICLTQLRHDAGYRCASYDRDFSRAMDFNTDAGFLCFVRFFGACLIVRNYFCMGILHTISCILLQLCLGIWRYHIIWIRHRQSYDMQIRHHIVYNILAGLIDNDFSIFNLPPSHPLPRLVLWVVLQMVEDGYGHLAPDCSSWGVPARGTSCRNFINVAGNLSLEWVRGANKMISRFLG